MCGAPVRAGETLIIDRCEFCQADNVVSPDVMARRAAQTEPVTSSYAQAVRQSTAAAIRSIRAAKLLALAMGVFLPLLTILLTLMAAWLLGHIHVSANGQRSYAAWETGDGICLGRIRERHGAAFVDFGDAWLRDVKGEVPIGNRAKLEVHRPGDLLGKAAFVQGGAATIERVYRELGSRSNRVELDLYGRAVLAAVPGLCLAADPLPEQRLRLTDKGNHYLSSHDGGLWWTRADTLWMLPAGASKPKARAVAADPILVIDADATHVYYGTKAGIYAVGRSEGDAVLLATLPADVAPRDLCLDRARVYYAAGDRIWRIPKEGGSDPWELAASKDAFGLVVHEGKLVFYSLGKRALMWVPAGGGKPSEIAKNRKVEAGLPLFVERDRVCFVNRSHHLIELSLDGGATKRLLSFGEEPDGFVRRGNDVFFWVHRSVGKKRGKRGRPGGLFHQRIGVSGKARNLAPTAGRIVGLALGASRIYWLDDEHRRIMQAQIPVRAKSSKKRSPSVLPARPLDRPGKKKP